MDTAQWIARFGQIGPSERALEMLLVAYVEDQYRVKPTRGQGTNASFWKFERDGREVAFVVVSAEQNTASPPGGAVKWLLRIEEGEPWFAADVAKFFKPGAMVSRRMSGTRSRHQFKSTDLIVSSAG
jgi:hypothetical protein